MRERRRKRPGEENLAPQFPVRQFPFARTGYGRRDSRRICAFDRAHFIVDHDWGVAGRPVYREVDVERRQRPPGKPSVPAAKWQESAEKGAEKEKEIEQKRGRPHPHQQRGPGISS